MKKAISILTILGAGLLLARPALAVCPVCTLAVAAGVGLSRWLGIDDTITGLWIGGLIVSMITWTLSWLDKKQIRFIGRSIITAIGYYALVVVPLYFMGVIGNPANAIYLSWLDKLLLGIIVGSAGFWAGASWYYYLKKNNSHAYFPFQKVVMPIAPLIILSVLFYFLTK